ncbi:MAG: pseudouridine synthase [Synechococcaceae cyanobacterium]|nr:pseudouridine synthase [Synechococcaceae cyanobacterium]
MTTTLTTLLFHKPYGVLSQFSEEPGSRWQTLAPFIPQPDVYAAGRLDADSEGLLLLTADGRLQHRLTDPRWGHWRRYHVQVEGCAAAEALQRLRDGVMIQGRRTLPARVRELPTPGWPEREPPIRHRLTVPTCWLELELREGRHRQVRRMTAAVGLPTLRLLRVAMDLMDGQPPLDLQGLDQGRWRPVSAEEQQRLQALLTGSALSGSARAAGWRSGRGGRGRG